MLTLGHVAGLPVEELVVAGAAAGGGVAWLLLGALRARVRAITRGGPR